MLNERSPLILASTSPTRADILRAHNIAFIQMESGFNEDTLSTNNPKTFVLQACANKLQSTLAKLNANKELERALKFGILCADSVISVEGQLLRKAKTIQDARNMLEFQSAKRISVLTAMSYQSERGVFLDMSVCHLELSRFSPISLEHYLESREWEGKAGCVMVEGFHKPYIRRQIGLESCARGLSVEKLLAFLEVL